MSATAQHHTTDLVDRIAAEPRSRVPSGLGDSAEHFIRRYFALVAPDDVIFTSPETLLGSALSLWEFGAERKPGEPKVRLFNPTIEKNGWALEHTVVEIVNDDMPFLVDSVSEEINRRERKIHLLLHPMLRVERGHEIVSESYMHIEIDQETEPAELETIRSGILNVLNQVRLAVADWRTMPVRLADDLAELAT